MSRDGEVITFYSYSGGVGCTLAVANTAVLLAREGKKVLVLDFDFIAPGLHYFLFRKGYPELKLGGTQPENKKQKGVFDLFTSLHSRFEADNVMLEDHPAGKIREIVASEIENASYGFKVETYGPSAAEEPVTFDFLPAVESSVEHANRGLGSKPHDFDWNLFYQDFGDDPFLALAEEWGKKYDYILIDAPHGITYGGSVCCMLLPEKLVVVTGTSVKSMTGGLDVAQACIEARVASNDLRPLPVFPLMSNIDNNNRTYTWVEKVRQNFERLYCKAYGIDANDVDLYPYFQGAVIFHHGAIATDPYIAAEVERVTREDSTAFQYSRFVKNLQLGNPNDLGLKDPDP